MKNIFTCLLVFTMLQDSYPQDSGQWKILNQGGGGTIDFVNENIGWRAGYNTLQKTEDGGDTWISIPSEEYHEMSTVDFINESTGWAIRDGVGIYVTTDGGYTWNLQFETEEYLGSLHTVNDSTVFLCSNLEVYKSSNAGIEWDNISPDETNYEFREVMFIDNNTGFILTNNYDPNQQAAIFRTFNGGGTWQILTDSVYMDFRNLQLINDSTGHIIAINRTNYNNFILETQDICSSWIVKSQSEYFISEIQFFNDDTAYAIIDYKLMRSYDSGSTWTALDSITYGAHSMNFNQKKEGFVTVWIGGGRGVLGSILYKTLDYGNNWTKIAFSYPFKDVFFLNDQQGYAGGGAHFGHGGSRGNLWYTEDGGNSWSIRSANGVVRFCLFVNDSTGFIIHEFSGQESYELFRSSDYGYTWEPILAQSGFLWGIEDMFFDDKSVGWSVGVYGDTISYELSAAIFRTTDVGKTWEIEWMELNMGLYSIHFINSTGWAVGENGLILKYTEQDQWQIQTKITELPLNDIFFSDENHGWIAGGYLNEQDFLSIILKTVDAGKNWSEKKWDKYLIKDLFFTDDSHGWAVGQDTNWTGILLETEDGGENWNPVIEDLSASLNALHFNENVGWVVGDNGLVLRTDNWTTWIDQSSGEIYPQKYQLYQNYPNPFNPATIIEYTVKTHLNASQHINLSIYNLLGQKVKTLVNKKQTAGNYQVTFDASGLASGIYYYQIRINNFIQTKKMIFIQ